MHDAFFALIADVPSILASCPDSAIAAGLLAVGALYCAILDYIGGRG